MTIKSCTIFDRRGTFGRLTNSLPIADFNFIPCSLINSLFCCQNESRFAISGQFEPPISRPSQLLGLILHIP
jgi:hypothetical protein